MIHFNGVSKWFGAHRVLDEVELRVPQGTLFVLCGESGAGKSTLLATVNGLEPIQGGTIFFDGAPLPTRPRALRALRRQIGVVFQSYNLFGHMTLEENVRLGLERSLGLRRSEATRLAHEHLDRLGLEHRRGAYPSEASGGEQQRAAIARCLAMRPKVILLDEPTAALDLNNSGDVVAAIRSLKDEGITILLATHQVGIFAPIADELACMKSGRIIEHGTLADLRLAGTRDSQIVTWLCEGDGDADHGQA